MIPLRRGPEHAAARKEASRLLRQVRGTTPADSAELIGWAHMLMQDHVVVQRLHIDLLLALGHADEASALIERALANHPRRLCLRLRRIRCMLTAGRLHEAAAEALFLAQARPQHVATFCVAAQALSAVGQDRRAREYLLRAVEHGSAPAVNTPAFVERLVDASLPGPASAILDRLPDAPIWLRAHVLVSGDRLCDALALLDSDAALRDRDDRTHILRLQLMSRLGHLRLLSASAARSGGDEHAVVAGECLLAAGDVEGAVLSLRGRLAAHGAIGDRARAAMIAALAMSGRSRIARRLASFLQHWHGAMAPSAATTNAWLLAFRGRLVSLNSDCRHHGRDPETSVLQPLLRRTMECFAAALEGDFQTVQQRDHLVRLRDQCALATGEVPGMTPAFHHRGHRPSEFEWTLGPDPSPQIEESPIPLRAAA